MPVILATQEAETGELLETSVEAEVAVSQDQTTALHPGQQSKTLSLKKKQFGHLGSGKVLSLLYIKANQLASDLSLRLANIIPLDHTQMSYYVKTSWLEAVAHACNPSTLGG